MSCLDEHLTTDCTLLGCNTMLLPSRVVPTTIQINYLTDSTDTFQRGRKRNTPNKIGQRNALEKKGLLPEFFMRLYA